YITQRHKAGLRPAGKLKHAPPNLAKPEPDRHAVHRRDAEISEISAEKTENRVAGKSRIYALVRVERGGNILPIPARIRLSWHLWEGGQRDSGAYQVGADLDGLDEFGFSLHLVFEAQVSETGEVMGVGRTGAAYTSAGGRRGLLQLIPRGLYQALEKRLGFFRLTQLLEGESLVVGLRGAAGGDAPELVAAAPCAGLGRRYRPLPGLRGFSGVPGAFIGYAGPVSEFCIASVDAAEKADGQVRRNGGGGFEIGQRFLVAFGANFRLGALNVGFGPLLHHVEIGAFGHGERVAGHGPYGVVDLAGGHLVSQRAVAVLIAARHHGGILLEQRQTLFERGPGLFIEFIELGKVKGVLGLERDGLLQLGNGFVEIGARCLVHVGGGQVAMGDGERGVESGRRLPHTGGFLGLPVV